MLADGIEATFSPAGHILGAASTRLSDGTCSVLFSGDLGRRTDPIMLHHLRQVAPHHRNTILIAGFQAAGTRGEALLHGASSLRVYGEDIPVQRVWSTSTASPRTPTWTS
ncbi:MAG: hypothetical protein AB7R77_27895 [Ilumatobacteraceae bacterium]